MTESRTDSAQMTKQDNLADGDNNPNNKSSTQASIKRNAFAELMSPKSSKALKPSSTSNSITAPTSAMASTSTEKAGQYHRTSRDPRSGLLSYIEHPNTYSATTVLRVTDDTVLIRDLYPKATIHLLLLPRSPKHYNLHPHEAFNDPDFLAVMQREAQSATDLAASELSRLISPHSAACRARNEAMDAPDPPPSLPPGRDFHRDLCVGVHAHPSMNHLHVHIVSRDMHSPALKHRKHYNSFNTDFFIPLADYPLSPDDERRSVSYQNANLSRDFVCWRCGKGFGNKFTKLKHHLDQEYVEWKSE